MECLFPFITFGLVVLLLAGSLYRHQRWPAAVLAVVLSFIGLVAILLLLGPLVVLITANDAILSSLGNSLGVMPLLALAIGFGLRWLWKRRGDDLRAVHLALLWCLLFGLTFGLFVGIYQLAQRRAAQEVLVEELAPTAFGQPPTLTEQLDPNQDGQVTPAEFAAYRAPFERRSYVIAGVMGLLVASIGIAWAMLWFQRRSA